MTPDIRAKIDGLRAKRRYKQALPLILEALEADAEDHELWWMAAECYANQRDRVRAKGAAWRSISLYPASYHAWYWLANALASMGAWEDAYHAVETSLMHGPGLPPAMWLRAHCHMALGQWEKAFADYEHGFVSPGLRGQRCALPWWNGEHCPGATLFVWGEQGHGDQIQMVRYLDHLRAMSGASIILECQAGLIDLFEQTGAMVVGRQPDLIMQFAADFQVPLMSLPHLLGVAHPVGVPYLTVTPNDAFRGKIGLCWKGNPNHPNDARRSLPPEVLERFRPHADRLVAIQPAHDCEWLEVHPFRTYKATAEAVAALDCLITVDTATAHIAGALGVRTILLAQRQNSESRFGMGRRTPWYDAWTMLQGDTWEPTIDEAIDLAGLNHVAPI